MLSIICWISILDFPIQYRTGTIYWMSDAEYYSSEDFPVKTMNGTLKV